MLTLTSTVGVRLAIPENAVLAPLFPVNNRWASLLLCRLLRMRMEAAGATVKNSDWAFPFNRSLYLFTVAQSPSGETLAAVWAEIAAVGLLAWAQIAWHAEGEVDWRLFTPSRASSRGRPKRNSSQSGG